MSYSDHTPVLSVGQRNGSPRRLVVITLRGQELHRDHIDTDNAFARSKVCEAVARKLDDSDGVLDDCRWMDGQIIEKARAADEEDGDKIGSAMIQRLSDVTPLDLEFLWPRRIPLGKLTAFAGHPDVGKSIISLDCAARVSCGCPWPDELEIPNQPGGIVLLSAEDDLQDTVQPRLVAAEADLTRIVALQAVRWLDSESGHPSERSFCLERDLPALEQAIDSCGNCRLVVVDPIDSYLGSVDSHRNAAMRGVLAPLAELAARRRVAVVGITHLNKTKGGPAMHRASGSVAFIAACRAAWLFAKDPDNPTRRLMLPIKANLTPDTDGLAYHIEAKGKQPYIAWESEPVQMSADDIVARQDEQKRPRLVDAADWLARLLRTGPMRAEEIQEKAEQAGHSWASVRRAKAQLELKVSRRGFGAGGSSYWSIDEHGCSTDPVTRN